MDNLVFKLTVEDDGSAKISAFERKIAGLQKEAFNSSSALKTAFNNVGNSIVDFTAKAGREFIQFSKDSVKAFLDFENALVSVAKTTGIPKENMGNFSEQIRETAVNLKGLGKDAAVQIANISEVAGQLGIASDKLAKGKFDEASTEILGFATTIAKAKIALPEFTGGVEQIATVTAKQLLLFGQTSDSAEQYLSVMNKLSDTTAATAVEISSFVSKFTLAPTLKITQEQSAAWAAAFISLGQNAFDAATRFQSGMAMILKGSKDTNVAIDNLFLGNSKMADRLLDMTGKVREFTANGKQDITSYANLAREALGKDANEAMKLLITTLSEVESTSERSELALKIFGQVGSKAILTLIPELPKLSAAAKEAATVFLSTNEQAMDALSKMSGVSRKKFSDNADFMAEVYKKDMPDAIRVLIEEIKKIDDEQEKARVASQVFGDDWEVTMNKAQGGVKLYDESLQTALKEIENVKAGAGSLQKEYDTALDKVGTSFSELTAIMDDIKLQWGAPLAEALSAGIKLMIPVIEELRKNFLGVVEEFGRELGGETLAGAFRSTAEAFKGVIEEMGANADIFIEELKRQFTLPNLLATAWNQWVAFVDFLKTSLASLVSEAFEGLSSLGADLAAAIGQAMEEMITAGIEKVKAGIQQVKNFIKGGITGGMSEAEYAKEMENIYSAQEIGLQNVATATEAKTAATQADLDALVQLKNANIEILGSNQALRDEYRAVASELGAAVASGNAPTEELTARMEALRQKIADVGVEAYGNSTFPDTTAAMQVTQAQTQALTAEMAVMQNQIKNLGSEYEATNAQIKEKQKAVRNLNKGIRKQQDLLRKASDGEKGGIRSVIVALQNKKDAIQNEISDLQELSRDQRDEREAEEEALKASVQQIKEKIKAANDLYREQQKQAADSIKWVDQLDEATKKRVFGGKDAVKVLQEQGVELSDLQQQELRRMQNAYKTEEAFQAQAEALQKQLGVSTSLSDNLSSLGNALSNIGGVFNVKGLGDIGGGLSELPSALKSIKESFAGLKGGIAGMTSGFSGFIGGISSITNAFSALSTAWEIGKSIFNGIASLFKNTKSKGTEAALAMQDFVKDGITGGAELAAAMGTAFDTMTANNFDFQASLQASGSTMSQVMGGISANWQQGVTAMDIFTQAVGKATGDMQKAPQVALQMMMGFDSMGLSAEQAGVKMLEIAEAAGLSDTQMQQLQAALGSAGAEAQNFAATASEVAATTQASISSNSTLTGSLNTVSSGYASAAQAAVEFARAQAQAAIMRQMQGLSSPATMHTGGMVEKYHTGGLIDWPRVVKAHSGRLAPDEVPIIAQTGEAVLNRSAVSMLGASGVNALNRGAVGGTVINVTITGNNITKDTNLRMLAREVSAEISKSYRARA